MDKEFAQYFSIWNQMTREQQNRINQVIEFKKIKKGTIVHDGSPDCLGMLLVCSGQLRAYLLNEEGREVTICRFFEMDVCLFTAACVMPNMQFDIFIEAEKDMRLLFRGSANQRIIDIPKTLKENKVVLWEKE